MTNEEIVLKEICQHIDNRPDKDVVYALAEKLRKLVSEGGELARLAVALVGAEMAAK